MRGDRTPAWRSRQTRPVLPLVGGGRGGELVEALAGRRHRRRARAWAATAWPSGRIARRRGAPGRPGGRPRRPALRGGADRGRARADVGMDRRAGPAARACWPGPVEVFLPWAGPERTRAQPSRTAPPTTAGARTVRAPSTAPGRPSWACPTGGRCAGCAASTARGGPCRSRFTEPDEVAQAFGAADVAVVVDGGRREGPPPTRGGRDGDADPRPARGRAAGLLHRRDHADEHAAQALLPERSGRTAG